MPSRFVDAFGQAPWGSLSSSLCIVDLGGKAAAPKKAAVAGPLL